MTRSEDQGGKSRNINTQFTSAVLGRGFEVPNYDGRSVFVKAISVDPSPIANYCKALELRTASGSHVVPPVYQVIVPMLHFTGDAGQLFDRKTEKDLPSATVSLLREAQVSNLLTIKELDNESDYDAASEAFGIKPAEFLNTMTQARLLIVVSEWVGPNALDFLRQGADSEVLRKLGTKLGECLAALHKADLIAGDTHLEQFVVHGDADEVMRIDLNNIKSAHELGEHLALNKDFEYKDFLRQLHGRSQPAADAFVAAYALAA